MVSRRQFTLGLSSLAFSGLGLSYLGRNVSASSLHSLTPTFKGYGPLEEDPQKLLDLPKGFEYKIISQLDDIMDDGLPVPDRADGMGCFKLDEERIALVRNHELHPRHVKKAHPKLQTLITNKAYDTYKNNTALLGGTSNLVYNMTTQTLEKQFLSLIGTIRNCAGGITPWGTWLSCEESVNKTDNKIKKDHGYIFEVPADTQGLVTPKPLKAMGRFNHEAAAVDPRTGIVYLTEDRGDSLFYRFIPNVAKQLELGGQLQALVIKNQPKFDSRNWDSLTMTLEKWYDVEWINLDNPESPEDDLRLRGYRQGAAIFARGEGIHWAKNELYFCCTNGGHKQLGQIMRLQPSASNSNTDRIQLFLESNDKSLYNFGDNLTVTPQGHLLICEDTYVKTEFNHLRGVTPNGEVYTFAKIRVKTEPAGACFSPDGSTMFINLYSPTRTLAITGAWDKI